MYNVVVGVPHARRVVLCHYGDAIKPSVATACTGDTDIDVAFNFTITN